LIQTFMPTGALVLILQEHFGVNRKANRKASRGKLHHHQTQRRVRKIHDPDPTLSNRDKA